MDINQKEKILKLLASKKRLQILHYLKEVEQASVWQISRQLKTQFKSISNHLAKLRAVDIVVTKRVKLEIYYSLFKPMNPLVKYVLSL